MVATISSFRKVSNAGGYIKVKGANNENESVTQFKPGIFKKIKTFVFGHDAKANKAIRADFINALNTEYGKSFVESKAISALLNEDQDFKTNAKPLSARLVRNIISLGDIDKEKKANYSKNSNYFAPLEAKLHINNKDYDVSLAYSSSQQMHAAADRFFQQANFDREGSVLMRDVAGYINSPTDEQFASLGDSPGAISFVRTFNVSDDDSILNIGTPAFKNHCLSVGVDPNDITTPASGKAQIPTRLNMLCGQLATSAHKSPAFFEGAVRELVEYIPRQIEMLKKGIEALSNPDIISEGMSDKDIQTLAAFKVELEHQLAEMINADGLGQHFLAFATVMAMDTIAAQEKMQALQPKIPTKMEILAESRRQASVTVLHDGKKVSVRSSYKNLDSMRTAASNFISQTGFSAKGSALMNAIVDYIAVPTQPKLDALLTQPNGERAVRFVNAFGLSDNPEIKHMQDLANGATFKQTCAAQRVNLSHIQDAIIANVQQSTRLPMLCSELASNTNRDPAQFKGIVKEVVSFVPNQVRTLERGIEALSKLKLKGDDEKAVAAMKEKLTAMLDEVADPEGPCQQLLAYATVAAMDLGAAQSQMQVTLQNA